jgi:hypothetical protein
MQQIMVILMLIEKETLQVFFLHISQMLDVSTFGNTADIYVIVHLFHMRQNIMVDGHACYCRLLAANQGNYVREHFLKKKTWKVCLSIGIRITMIHCAVYLLLIFKIVHGLMNNPELIYYDARSTEY